MKKEISPSEAIHELKKIQLKLRSTQERCQLLSYHGVQNIISDIQDLKVLLAKETGVPGY